MPGSWLDEAVDAKVENYHPAYRHGENSKSVTIRIPAKMERSMELALQACKSGGMPVQTYSDLMRDALFWYVQALLDGGHIDDPQLRTLQAATKAEDTERWMAGIANKALETTNNLTTALQRFILSGDVQVARRLYREHQSTVRGFEDKYIAKCYRDAMLTPDFQRLINQLEGDGDGRGTEQEDRIEGTRVRGAPRVGGLEDRVGHQ